MNSKYIKDKIEKVRSSKWIAICWGFLTISILFAIFKTVEPWKRGVRAVGIYIIGMLLGGAFLSSKQYKNGLSNIFWIFLGQTIFLFVEIMAKQHFHTYTLTILLNYLFYSSISLIGYFFQ